jgi:hypothetical protein
MKTHTLFFVFLFFVSLQVQAYDFWSTGQYYNYVSENAVAVTHPQFNTDFNLTSYYGDIDIPWGVHAPLGGLYQVTEIADSAYKSAPGWQDFDIITDSYLYVSDTVYYFEEDAMHDFFNIYTNVQWKVSSSADWLQVWTPDPFYGDFSKLEYTIDENTTSENRYADITISAEGTDTCVIRVYQQAHNAGKWEYVYYLFEPEWWTYKDVWLNKVYAQGTDNVFVVGNNGFIAKSADKGLSWHRQNFPVDANLNDIVFPDDETGFIVGDAGTILKTEDGGLTWVHLSSGTTQNINAVTSVAADTVWVVGNGGLIMQSTDNGNSWITKNYTNNRNLYDIAFLGRNGIIVGDRNQIITIENSGRYWSTSNAYANPDEYDKITRLCVTNDKIYAFVQRPQYYYSHSEEKNFSLIYTSDFVNWSKFNIDTELLVYYYPVYDCYVRDDLTAYIVYQPPIPTGSSYRSSGLPLIKTIDGGENWNNVSCPFRYSLNYSPEKAEFSYSSDGQFGYLLSGQILLRTPYTGDFYVGLDNIKADSKLIIKQQGNELQVSSLSKTISSIEIISITGAKLWQENNQTQEISVNTNNFSKGIYLVRAAFADKTNEVVKWIKQ